MIRSKIFKCATKQMFDHLLLKNNAELIYRNTCQSISTSFRNHLHEPLQNLNLKHNQTIQEISKESSDISEKEYLVRLKTDPDTFGHPEEEETYDEGDLREERYFTEQSLPSKKLSTKQYADMIKQFIRQRRIKEAIDVVEIRMLKHDQVKPGGYLFNLLLGACGRVGYTKKVFMLYNEMKRRGLKVTAGTYTALFNACANSPWPLTDGLTRANHLYDIMIEKGHEPNNTNYNAMIKAFGRCGDIPKAFLLVDEMYSKGISIKDDTINFLLQASISDKEAGFRHCLLIWRKLIDKNIKPSIYTYNLLLRSIRDCGLGDLEITQDVIHQIVSGEGKELTDKCETKLLSHTVAENNDCKNLENINVGLTCNQTNGTEVIQPVVENPAIVNSPKTDLGYLRPNLLDAKPHLGNIISLSEIKKPEERLLLVGGCKGFLENMNQYECTPDIKTFTQLLDCIPNTIAAENELINTMNKYDVKVDIDFYNMLMKRRSMRCDYDGAKEVLKIMKKSKFRPDLVTFGVLALSCKTKEECIELIETMKARSYSLNAEILGTMLHQACYHGNFAYVLHVMELCLMENVQPNKKFIATLDAFKKKSKESYNAKEFSKRHEQLFGIFKARYKIWLGQIQIDETEDEHPWQQYRETVDDSFKKYKTKDTARFKPIHRSLFRVKTSTKHNKK